MTFFSKFPHVFFSYHFKHEDYTIEVVPISYTLADVMNFLPLDDNSMTDERRTKQMMFLKEFVGSFTMNENHGMGNLEVMDKFNFACLGLAHSTPETVIYEEIGIKGPVTRKH